MGDLRAIGAVVTLQDGKVAWTTHADLAHGAAVVLAGRARFEGPTRPSSK